MDRMDNDTLDKIVRHIIEDGTQNTSQGNWIIYFEELPHEFGGADFIAHHKQAILERLNEQAEVVAEADIIGDSFDVCYYLAYCPNAELHDGEDEIEEILPLPEIGGKPSILARLQDSKKAAAQVETASKSAPKRNMEMEV